MSKTLNKGERVYRNEGLIRIANTKSICSVSKRERKSDRRKVREKHAFEVVLTETIWRHPGDGLVLGCDTCGSNYASTSVHDVNGGNALTTVTAPNSTQLRPK